MFRPLHFLFIIVFFPALLLAQPKITFDSEKELLHWDTIVSDSVYRKKIWFTNTGDTALIISSISSSDGGLFASGWPREKVQPGERAYFTILFDTESRRGPFNRSIRIRSNAANYQVYLNIKGFIKYTL